MFFSLQVLFRNYKCSGSMSEKNIGREDSASTTKRHYNWTLCCRNIPQSIYENGDDNVLQVYTRCLHGKTDSKVLRHHCCSFPPQKTTLHLFQPLLFYVCRAVRCCSLPSQTVLRGGQSHPVHPLHAKASLHMLCSLKGTHCVPNPLFKAILMCSWVV